MSRQARVGLLVFAGLALFMMALFALANRSFLFSDTFIVRSQFNGVSGLQAGAPVQFQGVNVGRVESVRLPDEPRGKLVVTMAIQERARHLIHTNTQAQIKTDGLVGNMIVVLVNPPPTSEDTADAEPIEEGDFIPGVDPFDFFEITDKALASVQRFEESATSFEQIVLDIRNGEGTIGKLIYDDELYTGLVGTTEETQRLMNTLGRDAEALVTLATEATEGVESILEKVDSGDGTIAKMINDPGVYNSLLATADTLQAISTNLRALSGSMENMANWGALGAFRFAELMEAGKHNWLFKRYFEERGYMEKPDFETRERALAESYLQLQQKQRELAQWEERLRTQAARIDSVRTTSSLDAPPSDADRPPPSSSGTGSN